MDIVEGNLKKIEETWGAYMASYLTPEERRIAEKFSAQRTEFVEEGVKPAIVALRLQDVPHAAKILNGPLT